MWGMSLVLAPPPCQTSKLIPEKCFMWTSLLALLQKHSNTPMVATVSASLFPRTLLLLQPDCKRHLL
jgi:hypothetical protein